MGTWGQGEITADNEADDFLSMGVNAASSPRVTV
jgi:hypothetical protein